MRKETRWIYPEIDSRAVAEFSQAVGIHGPAARVLWKRGFRTSDSARQFLQADLSGMHDPWQLRGMHAAVDRLQQAIERREKVLLYGDYDVDGTSSIVVLTKALELAGARVQYHVPHRLREGYGMQTEAIDKAAADGVTLIVSVDTGIRAVEAVRQAKQLGIDVIVTDHHLPDSELPPALAIINPNQANCPYPEKNLCGAGVTFKLVQALWERLNWPAERVRRLSESFLKLVAMATVADVVPLTGENRIIVRVGLQGFTEVRNPGLRALLASAGFQPGDCPSAGQVAFRIAPRINAAGRMAHADDVIRMFLTDNEATAREIAAQLSDLNQERQQTEADIVRSITDECAMVPIQDDQAALVFCGEGWHRGVVGIVASRLVERYHRPVFVLSAENGIAQGSGRSISVFHLLDAMESMPDLFTKFGGHRQAAGLTMSADRVAEFRQRINEYARHKLTPDDYRPTLELDSTLQLGELTDESAAEILTLAPFGFGNPCPIFAVQRAEIISEPVVFAEKHLRLKLRQHGVVTQAKAWGMADRREELRAGSTVNVALTVEDDPYSAARGYSPWGVVVKDVQIL